MDKAVIYRSHFEAIETLPEDQQLEALKAIVKYCMDGDEPKTGTVASGILGMAKPILNKWKSNVEAGSKGGKATPKQTTSKPQATRKQTASKSQPKEESIKNKDKKNKKDILSGRPDDPPLMAAVGEIVDYLNEKTGSRYQRHNKATVDLIKGRMSEKYTVEDFKTVIDKMTAAWKDDPKMCGYLRPSTLFARAHFEEYMNYPDPDRWKKTHKTAFHNFPQRSDPGSKDLVQQLIAAQN